MCAFVCLPDAKSTLDQRYIQETSLAAQHYDAVNSIVEESATYTFTAVSGGSAQSRLNFDTTLVGEGAMADVNGVMLASGRQRNDFHTTITHAVENANSE